MASIAGRHINVWTLLAIISGVVVVAPSIAALVGAVVGVVGLAF